jgi:hypothetical protein
MQNRDGAGVTYALSLAEGDPVVITVIESAGPSMQAITYGIAFSVKSAG